MFLGVNHAPQSDGYSQYPVPAIADFGLALETDLNDPNNPANYTGPNRKGTDGYFARVSKLPNGYCWRLQFPRNARVNAFPSRRATDANVTQVMRTQLTWSSQEHLTGDRPLGSYTNVWAIGMIMWELLRLHGAPAQLPGGQPPLMDYSAGSSSLPPRTATTYRAELDDLVFECLNPDVTRRPTLPDLRRDVRVFLDAYRQSGDLPALGHLPVDPYPIGTPRPPSPDNHEEPED